MSSLNKTRFINYSNSSRKKFFSVNCRNNYFKRLFCTSLWKSIAARQNPALEGKSCGRQRVKNLTSAECDSAQKVILWRKKNQEKKRLLTWDQTTSLCKSAPLLSKKSGRGEGRVKTGQRWQEREKDFNSYWPWTARGHEIYKHVCLLNERTLLSTHEQVRLCGGRRFDKRACQRAKWRTELSSTPARQSYQERLCNLVWGQSTPFRSTGYWQHSYNLLCSWRGVFHLRQGVALRLDIAFCFQQRFTTWNNRWAFSPHINCRKVTEVIVVRFALKQVFPGRTVSRFTTLTFRKVVTILSVNPSINFKSCTWKSQWNVKLWQKLVMSRTFSFCQKNVRPSTKISE